MEKKSVKKRFLPLLVITLLLSMGYISSINLALATVTTQVFDYSFDQGDGYYDALGFNMIDLETSTAFKVSGNASLTSGLLASWAVPYTSSDILNAESWTLSGNYYTDAPDTSDLRVRIRVSYGYESTVDSSLMFNLNSSNVHANSDDLQFNVEAGIWYNFSLTLFATGEINVIINNVSYDITPISAFIDIYEIEPRIDFNNYLDLSPYLDNLAFSYTSPDPQGGAALGNSAVINLFTIVLPIAFSLFITIWIYSLAKKKNKPLIPLLLDMFVLFTVLASAGVVALKLLVGV